MTRLSQLIKNKGFSYRSFALFVGLSPSHVSRLARNHRWPGVGTAIIISTALGETPASIWPTAGRRPAKRAQ